MRSASDRRSIGLAGLLGAIALVGASCARVHIEPGTGTGGDGGDSGHGGAAGGRGGADSGSGGSAGAGGSVGGAIGGGGSGGGGTAGSAGAAGRGGTGGGSGGTAGSAGAGGRGGTGGGGTGGTAGSGGSAGSGGTAGSAGSGGTAGSGGAGGRGGSGGTAGSAGTGGVIVPMGTTPSVAGQIVITELMHNTTTISDDTGEWIEVYNPSATVTYDLLGCEVSDTSPPGDIVDANLVLPPMTFKTMAVSAAPGFTPDYVYTPVGVAPVVKFDNQGGDGAQLRCGGVLIDEFTYPSTVAPNAGHSFSVDPDHYNTIDNDSMANWCNARDTMPGDAYETSGPNYGTPGRANTQCP